MPSSDHRDGAADPSRRDDATSPHGDPLATAADPTTPPSTLTRLARHRDARVRAAVARNPNTSRRDLESLALVTPDAVASNPVLDWWLLEDPDWLASTERRARHRLLASGALRAGTAWWAARFGDPDDQGALLQRADLPADVVAHLAQHATDDIAAAARDHVALDEHDMETLAVGTLAADADDARDVLAHASPAAWAIDALDLSSVDLRRALAVHADTPLAVLRRLALDDEPRVSHAALAHRALDEPTRRLIERVRASADDLTDEELRLVLDSPVGLLVAAVHPNLDATRRLELAVHDDWRIRQAVAPSPLLPERVVEDLALDADRDVRAAVAGNPALPAALLVALGTDRDEIVRDAAAGNPAYAAASRSATRPSNAELRERVAEGRSASVATFSNLPIELQRTVAAADDWRTRHLVASNPTTAPSVLASLADDPDLDVRRAVLRNARTAPATVASFATDTAAELRQIAAERTTRPASLRRLANDADGDVRIRVAENPHTPAAVVAALARDAEERVRRVVAGRPHLSKATRLLLAADLSDDVRAVVVTRADADEVILGVAFGMAPAHGDPPEPAAVRERVERARRALADAGAAVSDEDAAVLLRDVPWLATALVRRDALAIGAQHALAGASDWRIREALAARPDTAVELLVRLASDSDYDTRAAAARHPALPPDCLAALANDDHRAVRLAVAGRTDLDERSADRLSVDDDDEVRAAMAMHASTSTTASASLARRLEAGAPVTAEELAAHLDSGWVRRLAAAHPSSDPVLLAELAADTRWEVRENVAAHPATSPDTLRALAADTDRDVRRAVAAHPSTPADVVAVLCTDVDRGVVRAATANPCRGEAERATSRDRAVRDALRSSNAGTRILALACVAVPPSALRRRRHMTSPDWRERAAVARHPATPVDVRRRLALDGVRTVRRAAAHPDTTAGPST